MSTIINIYIFCFNESVLLPHTVAHYKKYLPSCTITIYDNESTDNSVEIAKKLGCGVVGWKSGNINNSLTRRDIANNCWKYIKSGWILIIDMDEWLCVTEQDLQIERLKGTNILTILGLEMIGESKKEDVSDIDLFNINKYVENKMESKSLCFLRNQIKEMNYNAGAHKSTPECNLNFKVTYSSTQYYNKHMNILGLPFFTKKMIQRFNRSHEMRKINMSTHYMEDSELIAQKYKTHLDNSKVLTVDSFYTHTL
jgi:glycosyltransferase involved in cell wall biosynthesis